MIAAWPFCIGLPTPGNQSPYRVLVPRKTVAAWNTEKEQSKRQKHKLGHRGGTSQQIRGAAVRPFWPRQATTVQRADVFKLIDESTREARRRLASTI